MNLNGVSLGIVWLIKYLGTFDYACLLFPKQTPQNFHFHNFEICLVILKKYILKKWAKAALRKKRNLQKLVQPCSL